LERFSTPFDGLPIAKSSDAAMLVEFRKPRALYPR
jgi:hypothetical protein